AIMTPWPAFRALKPADLARVMAGRTVLDPYRILDGRAAAAAGLDYFTLGGPPRRAKGDRCALGFRPPGAEPRRGYRRGWLRRRCDLRASCGRQGPSSCAHPQRARLAQAGSSGDAAALAAGRRWRRVGLCARPDPQ